MAENSREKILAEFGIGVGPVTPEKVRVRDIAKELPSGFKQVGKDIGQSVARSFAAVGTGFRGGGLEDGIAPETELGQRLTGTEEEISFGSVGEEVMAMFGKEDSRFAVPLGIALVSLDVIPGLGTGVKSTLKVVAKNVAKSTDKEIVKKELVKVFKGAEDEVDALATGLVKISDEAEVAKILDNIATKKKVVDDPRAAQLAEFEQRTARQSADLARETAEDVATRQAREFKQPITPSVVKQVVRPQELNVRQQVKTELERLRNLERGGVAGRRQATQEIKNLQDAVVKTARRELPVALRGGLLKAVTDATNSKAAVKSFNKVFDKIDTYNDSVRLSKELGTRRGKIAFITKMGELSATLVRDAKKTVGIKGSTREVKDVTKLDELITELKERTRVRQEKGFKTTTQKGGQVEMSKAEYDQAVQIATDQRKVLPRIRRVFGSIIDQSKKGTDKVLGVMSTRLKNISPALKASLRDNVARNHIKKGVDKRKAEPFMRKFATLRKEDFSDFTRLDLAMKNRDGTEAMRLIMKHGMRDEFDRYSKMLDDLYKEAVDKGVDVNYLPGFIPRQVVDSDGLYDLMTKSKNWNLVEEAIRAEEIALGKQGLDKALRTKIINSLVRGYNRDKVNLPSGVSGIIKERRIDKVTPEMNQFYADSVSATENYINAINDQISFAKYFGKNVSKKIKSGEPIPEVDVDATVGALVDNMHVTGKLTAHQMDDMKDMLKAIFSPRGPGKFVTGYKNLAYATVMGGPKNAVTQIGDLAFSLAKNGLVRTLKGALVRDVRKEDLGIEKIMQELTDVNSGAVVDKIFKLSGLTGIDTFGKNTSINASLIRFKDQAIKNPEELTKSLKRNGIIAEENIDSTIASLKRDEITDDVKVLLFSELSEVQPISLLETPEKYASSGNGRIFYMLKTWSIKALDVYRNDVIHEMKRNPVAGMRNFIKLTGALVMMNATADEIKDFMSGKDNVDFGDRVTENIIKITGFNRYAVDQAKQQGLVSAVFDAALPPAKVFDDLWKDGVSLSKGDKDNIRTVRSIPIGGDLYYWWFGGGAHQTDKSTARKEILKEFDLGDGAQTRESILREFGI